MSLKKIVVLLAACTLGLPVLAQGAIRIEPIVAYNFVVDSNVLSPSTYAPEAATIGAQFCNDGAVDINDVSVYTGDFSGTPTPGLYPQRDSTQAGFIAEHAHLANTGFYSLTHEGGSAGLNDATRYIGTLAAGECSTQYWLISYPRTDPAVTTSVTGGSIKPDDDLWLEYDFWATAGGVDEGDLTRRATMRNEISAAANKIWPNGDNKVPDEYKQAIVEVLGWDTLTPGGGSDAYPGETMVTSGVWYDLGNVGAGFDNDGDLVPDKNIWLQPIGDPNSYDPGCFRLVRTYGLVIVKLKGGGEKLIPFENQLYFSNIPANTGAVGLVFYEYVSLDGACTAALSPYQEVASGFDNEKFSGDYGFSIPPLQSKQSLVTISKVVDQATMAAPPGGTLTYTVDFNNAGAADAGNPAIGAPLVIQEEIPAGTDYIAGSTTTTLASSVVFSTDNGVSWVSTEPVPASTVTNIQWWLDAALAAGASGTVTFQVTVPGTFTGVLVDNTAGISIGNANPFAEDDAVTLISGVNTIGDTVFADDGSGGGTVGNGIQDGTESGTNNVKVSLYYDKNGDGLLDPDDVLWGEQDTAGAGNYSFGSLPDGDFIVVVDQDDADLPAGAGPTTPIEYAVTLAGADFLNADFGFVATLAVTKTLTSANPVYKGDPVTFDISVTNQLTPGPPQSCTYTTWPNTQSANVVWLNPANALGAPDGSLATVDFGAGGSWKPLIANGWGVGTPAGNITQVEILYEGSVTGTLGNDLMTARYYFGAGNSSTYDEINYDSTSGLPAPNGTFSLVWDVTTVGPALAPHTWTFADFAAGVGEVHLEVDSTTQNAGDPADLNIDALGFRITTDQSCNPDTLVTVPLTDTYDSSKLQYVSATVAPDTVTSGLLTWNNVGPIAAGATQTITVNYIALSPGIEEITTTNTANVTNALFFDGSNANDATDSADVNIRPVGSIGDTIFWDANANGQQDANEPGVPGVDVTLTFPDTSTLTVTTDANGKYLFSNLRPSLVADDYIVTVDTTGPLSGFALMADPDADGVPCTDPSVFAVCDSIFATTITAGANVMGADFGYQPPGVIGDTLWNDANNNGVRDDGEYGIPFITVTIVELGLTTETDSDGFYSFSNIPDGTYTIRVDIADPDFPPGLTVSYDNDGAPLDNETPVTIAGGSIFLDADFGYRYAGTNNLSGTICLDDPTFNGVCGVGDSGVEAIETALSGTTAYLYLWNDGGVIGVVEPGETTPVASTLTDALGDYSFTNIPDGQFVVAVGAPLEETLLTTTVADTPAIILVKNPAAGENISAYQGTANIAGSTSITGLDYAYRLIFNYDFGDLPNVYLTKLVAGARHEDGIAALYLGTTIDYDFNGMPTADATGDDVDASDDEDGVTVVSLTSWAEGTVAGGFGGEVDVDVAGTGYLTGWIDFNGDGFLTGPSEMIVDQSVSTGTYNITFDIPVGGLSQNLYARFRLFPAAPPIPPLSYRGAGDNGEVEDYLIVVLGSIGDYIWNDANGDGVQDGTESGIDGVTVDLYRDVNGDGLIDAGDALVTTVTTAGGGLYDFTGLVAGNYIVDVTDTGSVLTGFGLTGGTDPRVVAGLTIAQDFNNADFGYQQQNASIGDFIWNDLDGDGVQDGGGEVGIDGVTVDLYRDVNGDGLIDGGDVLVTTVTTAGGGLYDFTGLPLGDYIVDVTDTGSVLTGFALTGGSDPVAVGGLTAGQDFNTADFGYQQQNASIGDFIWNDLDGDGVQDGGGEVGIDGVTVDLYRDVNGDGLIDAGDVLVTTVTTAGGGLYDFTGLAADDYIVDVTDTGSVLTGFALSGGSDPVAVGGLTAGQDFNNADFGYQQQNASIGDFIWNDLDGDGVQDGGGEVGIDGVTVDLYRDVNGDGLIDGGDVLVTTVTTAGGGLYDFTGLPLGDYIVDVTDTGSVLTGFALTGGSDPVAVGGLTAGQDFNNADFGYQQQDASIGDFIWNDLDGDGVQDGGGEVGIDGVTVDLYRDVNGDGLIDAGDVLVTTVTTAGGGLYDFTGLPLGDYIVDVTDTGSVLTGFALTGGSDPVAVGGLTAGQDFNSADFGYQQQNASIGDFIWNDLDGDGVQDGGGEVGIDGVTVDLYRDVNGDGLIDGGDVLVTTVTTAGGGLYDFTGLPLGDYIVDVTDTGSVLTGFALTGGSDPVAVGGLTAGQDFNNADFGYQQQDASIGDFIWNDLDGDGVQDGGGEVGIDGVTVDLYRDVNGDGLIDAGDVLVTTVTTAGGGLYDFTGLPLGDYIVDVTDTGSVLTGFALTGGSDPVAVGGLTAGQDFNSADFGYQQQNASIGDFIWNDLDGDGVQDGGGEVGIDGVTVDLYRDVNGDGLIDGGDVLVTTVTTAGGGLYDFTGLPLGDYIVDVTDTGSVLTGFALTGGSDPVAVGGLTAGQDFNSADFGYQQQNASIGDFIWNDLDGDGVQDGGGEVGIDGVTVDLYRDVNGDGLIDAGDVLVTTVTTAGGGLYDFTGLAADDYIVDVTDTGSVLTGFALTGGSDPVAVGGLTAGQDFNNADFGYQQQNASIGDFIWNDLDGDGVQDGGGEVGIDGVTVDLYRDVNGDGLIDAGDMLVTTVTTAGGGLYDFTGLPLGDYIVDVTDTGSVLTGFVLTGGSDPVAVGGLTAGQDYNNADFGYLLAAPAMTIVKSITSGSPYTAAGQTINYSYVVTNSGNTALAGPVVVADDKSSDESCPLVTTVGNNDANLDPGESITCTASYTTLAADVTAGSVTNTANATADSVTSPDDTATATYAALTIVKSITSGSPYTAAGQTINYSYVVTNSGNTALAGPVVVADDKSSDESCPLVTTVGNNDGNLDPGESITCTASYTTLAADVTAGSVTNTANATADSLTSPDDTATATYAALTIVKSITSGSPYTAAGQVINYSYVVTNTGSTALAGPVVVADDKSSDESCPLVTTVGNNDANLDPGESITCTASYTTLAADVTAGSVTNTASATADSVTSPDDTATATYAGLTIVKSITSGNPYTAAGQTINYSYVVTNNGSTALADPVVVADDKSSDESCPAVTTVGNNDGNLDPGESITCSASYTTLAADVTAGSVTNTASATVDSVTSPDDTATATYAELTIVKSITGGNPFTAAGQTINYSYLVTNSGNTALAGPVTVADDKSSDESCPAVTTVGNNDANLDPGESITCTATYTTVAGDVTAGSVTNIASATADSVTSPTDTETATYAALTIVKSITGGSPFTAAGQVINYSYLVTNSGNTALAGPVTVADDKSTDESCPAVTTVGNNDANLDPGESITCTATYTTVAGDVTAGSVTNIASATADSVTSPTDTETATYAGLTIVKSITSGNPFTAAGQTINYSYVVTNNGSAALAGPVTVADDKSTDESCPAVTTVGNNDANLDPGESITCTATYTTIAGDVTAGSVTNIASATADSVTSPTDTETATYAALTIVKSITGGNPFTAAGQTINYSYLVTNSGNTALAGPVTVADDKSSDESCPLVTTVGNNDANLDPGESITCTATYTTVAGDVTAGSVTNIASATADSVTSPTDTATATYAALTIVKSITGGSPFTAAGQVINYSYLVTNSGNTALAGPVTVADDKSTDESCPAVTTVGNNDANLDPGESITCTATYTTVAGDVTAGSVTNIASATADSVTSPTDTETATYAGLTIVKSITSGNPFTAAGQTINYSYVVTNNGSTALADPVVVADDKSSDESCPAVTTVGNNDGNLDPGESITCTATYTTVAGDVTAGSVTNIASATADSVTSPTDTETATYAALTIVKSITGGNPFTAAGQTINYSYLVTNSGNTALAGPVTVADDKSSDESCPAVTTVGNNDANLDPGESITCTATYTTVAGDVTAGSVTNIASATADSVTSPTDTETATYAGLTIVKSITGGSPFTAAGQTINYSYLVTNSGNTALAGPVTVADDKSTDESCPAVTTVGNNDANLDPGESITCTATYTTVAGDVTAGSVTNIASATADSVTSPTDTETATYAGLTIVKSITSGNPYTAAGQTINYSYDVTNNGSTSLAGPVTVADDKSTDESCPAVTTVGNNDANLDPGESITCTASYTTVAGDVTAGSVTNIASATADSVTSPTDTETATYAALTIVKSITGGNPFTAAGQTINYSYLVTNSGNTALAGPVTVADDKSSDESCPLVSTVGNNDGNLDPGESIICTASYTTLAADVTAGSVTNTANATADSVTSPDDTATATYAELTIVKSITSGSPYTAAGQTLNYSYVVTNTGNTALAGPVVVADDKSTDESCPAVTTVGNNDANLDPGESITCTASYTTLAADVTAGSVTNTANATADSVTSPDDTATATYAGLTIVKSITSGNPYTAAGQTINYSYVVTNNGSTALAGPVVVADDKSSDESCPLVSTVGNNDGNLDPGESITCTASYTTLAADVTAGSVTNTANATADSVTSPDDTATATYAELTIVKSITSGNPYTAAGQVLNYSYVVTNSGNTALAGPVVVADDKSSDESCPLVSTVGNNDGNLDPGESITCTASYTTLAADVTAGSVTNTANATADSVTSPDDTATATYAELTIVKSITSGNPYTAAGQVLNYSYVVTNSGSTALAGPVVVADDKSSDESCPLVSTVGNNDGNLDPGESITCTASYTTLAADVTAGSVTNTANATADSVTSPDDTATATYAGLTIVKSITSGNPYTAAGQTINYSYVVTNNGSTALAGPVTVADDKSTDESCPAVTTVGNNDGNLDPGESITCTATYTTLAADVTAGSVTNTANATADSVTSPDDTATATYAELTIVKSITSGSPYTASGQTVNYSYVVTNSGNTTLAGPVVVADDKSTDESCPAVTTVGNGDANFDPGESITCTATYTTLATDVTAGSVTNTANATADSVTSPDDTATATYAELTVVKSITSGSPYTAAGETINYSYVVTNSGNTALAGPVVVADDKSTDESCPNVNTVGNNDANFDPGESITCTATYTTLAADVTAGSVTNTASATADSVTSPDDTATATYAGLTIVKSITSGNPYTAAGQTINYSYVVTNNGSTALAGPVVVADDKSTDESCPAVTTVGNNDANLDPGESITCTATYTTLAGDVAAGSVTNVASATADSVTSPDDTATATYAELTIVKSITSGSPYTAAGQTVNYSYVVTNSGNTTLAGPVVVADDKSTDESCPAVTTVGNGDANFDPGESITCTATYTTIAGDVTAGSVTNIASATADSVTSPTDTETATYAALTIVKSITGGSPFTAAGQTINYSYLVTNSGNTALAGPVTVADDKSTDESCPAVTTVGNNDGNLDPGESITCTATYTTLAADVTAGSVTNIASATADSVTSPTDTETATYAGLTIVKSITGGSPFTAAGQTINYSYLVTNSGNTALAGPVTVADDKSSDESCPAVTTVGNNDGNLDPGESITCTATYTTVAGDVTAGSVTNVASATADSVTSPDDTATATYAELTIVKSITSGSPYTAAGQTVNYSYVVTNSGNTTLAGPVVVADDKSTDESCPAVTTVGNNDANLDPGESITCTATYTTLAADVTAGSVTNTANATADSVTSPDDTATATYAELTIVKSITSGSPYTAAGQTINYSYVVTNSGNTALAGPVVVADDKSTDESCPAVTTVGNNDGNLDPGESITCTASYTTLAADVTAGSVTNTASATADSVTSPDDTATATYAGLTIVKSITSGTPYTATGQTINYSYVVTNNGSTALAGPVVVADDKSSDESCPAVTTVGNNDGNLDPGESITCTASYTTLAADVTAGSVTNIASATADSVTSPDDTATATYAGLTIVKSITSGSPYTAAGQTINYSYVVTNSGNTALAGPVVVADDKSSDESCPAVTTVGNNDGNLDPGESITCTATYTVTQADLDAGSVVNIATASADGITSPPDTETATGTQSPALTMVKTITAGSPYTAVGNTVDYDYLVTNSGNITLAGPVTVADDKTTVTCPAVTTIGNLDANFDVGESITCTASYTITQADLDAGSVTNTATASADGTTSPPDDETANAIQLPSMTVTKTQISGGNPVRKPGTLGYRIVIRNTGNVSLNNVIISDTLPDSTPGSVTGPTGDAGSIGVLDVGETWIYTASYVVTQADVDAGEDLVNLVSVISDETPGPVEDDAVTPVKNFPWLLFTVPILQPQCSDEPMHCYMISDRDNQGSDNSALLKYTFRNEKLELVGRLGVGNIEASTLSLDGKILYAMDSNVFGVVDLTPGNNASFTPVNPAGIGTGNGAWGLKAFNDIDGMSFDPTSGKLYASQRLPTFDLLLQIDPETGTFVKDAFGKNLDYIVIGYNDEAARWYDIDDLAIDESGVIYGIANTQGFDDRFVIIDKVNGYITNLEVITTNDGFQLNDMEGFSYFDDHAFFGTTGIETLADGTVYKNSFFRLDVDPVSVEKIISLDQNFNGYIPYDFESVACRRCPPRFNK